MLARCDNLTPSLAASWTYDETCYRQVSPGKNAPSVTCTSVAPFTNMV